MLVKIGHTHYYEGKIEDEAVITAMSYKRYEIVIQNDTSGYNRFYIYCATLTEALACVNEMNKADDTAKYTIEKMG